MPRWSIVVSLYAVAAIALTAGCGSTGKTEGQKRVENLTASINSYADAMRDVKIELQKTLAAHDRIVNNTDGDLATPFRDFSRGLNRIDSRKDTLAATFDQMKKDAQAVFLQWEAELVQIESESLRQRSRDRLDRTKERFNGLTEVEARGKGVFQPLMKTLRDHERFLSSDLNRGAAAELAKDTPEIEKNAAAVYEIVDGILAATAEYNKAVASRTGGQ
jgi:type II secretory pathway pseudopilin PulG